MKRRLELPTEFVFADSKRVSTPEELAACVEAEPQREPEVLQRLADGDVERWLHTVERADLAEQLARLREKPAKKQIKLLIRLLRQAPPPLEPIPSETETQTTAPSQAVPSVVQTDASSLPSVLTNLPLVAASPKPPAIPKKPVLTPEQKSQAWMRLLFALTCLTVLLAVASLLLQDVPTAQQMVLLVFAFPLILGVLAWLFRLDHVVSAMERFNVWVDLRRERLAVPNGWSCKFVTRPFLAGMHGIRKATEGIKNPYARAGVRVSADIYYGELLTSALLLALYVIVIAILVIASLVLILWIIGKMLESR